VRVDLAAALERYCALFAALQPADLVRLPDFYTPDARFKDPFNDVRGVAGVQAVFAHMYAVTEAPRFEVLERALSGDTGFVRWRFVFAPQRRPDALQQIEGVSRVVFAPDGRVAEHVDYWDPAEAIYAGLPVLGPVLRLLRRKLGAGADSAAVG
jgi:ketosteroid isomerase-like protein